MAAAISRLPLPSSPPEGWANVDATIAALIATGRGRRWWEGWLGDGRARPLAQRLAAGIATIGIIGGGAGAAAGVSPIDVAKAFGETGSGIVRYVFGIDDDSSPPPSNTGETVPGTASPTPPLETATPETPATQLAAAETPAPTPTTFAPTETAYPASDAGTVTIRHSSDGLALLGVVAATGWTYEVEHEEPDRIEVRFEFDDDDDSADDVDDDDSDSGDSGDDDSGSDDRDDVRFRAELRDGAVVVDVGDGE